MLNEQIKELRKSFGISQIELAKELGVSKQCVSNWENDNVQPSIDMLIKIAQFFKVSCDFILGLSTDNFLDLSELSEKEAAHIRLIVKDLQEK